MLPRDGWSPEHHEHLRKESVYAPLIWLTCPPRLTALNPRTRVKPPI